MIGVGRRRTDPTVQALCLAARTRPSAAALAELRSLGPQIDWARLAALGHLHDVLPLLARSVPAAYAATATGSAISAASGPPPGWIEAATRRRHVTAQRNGELADELLRVLAAFDASGIASIPVKGLMVAEWAYDDLAARPAADIDVLIHAADLPASREIARSLGYRQASEPTFTTIVHEFHDAPWFLGDGGRQTTLEIHWSLWSERFARIPVDDLWARARPGELLGRPTLLLAAEDVILHLAIHRSRSPLRLRWVVDIAEAIERHGAEIDWAALVDRARRGGAATATWVVLDLARRILDAPVPEGVLESLRPGRLQRALLERTCGAIAMFRPAPGLDQQPHLTLRVLELDGGRAIGAALLSSVRRSIRRILHERGIRRVDGRAAAGGE